MLCQLSYLGTDIFIYIQYRTAPPLRKHSQKERETGFEPATPSLEGSCSSQLSYSRVTSSNAVNRALRRLSFCCASRRGSRRARGGEGRIRTSEGVIQQIYSLPRLAASVPHLEHRLSRHHPATKKGLSARREMSFEK